MVVVSSAGSSPPVGVGCGTPTSWGSSAGTEVWHAPPPVGSSAGTFSHSGGTEVCGTPLHSYSPTPRHSLTRPNTPGTEVCGTAPWHRPITHRAPTDPRPPLEPPSPHALRLLRTARRLPPTLTCTPSAALPQVYHNLVSVVAGGNPAAGGMQEQHRLGEVHG